MPVAAQELTRLAREGDVIVVRNTQKGITVFQDDQLNITTTWEADGDINGGHVREMSATALKNPDFRSNVLRGVFVLESAPDVLLAAIEASKAEWDSRTQARVDTTAAISRAADRTIAKGKTCIAPKGRDVCGNISMEMENRPPLCSEHQLLANQYVQVEGPNGSIWKRAGR